jgi:DsbC/DsbD-like thiol-disulfide interchange protein
MNRLAIICLLLLLIPSGVDAQPKSDLVQVELMADVSAVKPGEPFRIGVLLHIAPRWHVYWLNPGDSGLATSVHFKLPAGFKAGPVQFPVPRRLMQPGDVVNYGYEDQVLLLAKVTPPSDLKPGAELAITADLRWLCCKEVCLPGSAKAQLTLASAATATPANEKIFQDWSAQVPSAKPAEVKKQTLAVKPDGKAQVEIQWKRPAKDVQLFPGASDAIVVSDVAAGQAGDSSTITFQIHRLAGIELDQPEFPIVIGYTDADGHRRGLSLAVPTKLLGPAQSK